MRQQSGHSAGWSHGGSYFSRSLLHPRSHRGALTAYLATIAIFYAVFAAVIAISQAKSHPPMQGANRSVPVRTAFYEQHKSEYDLVFLGDSRTYCGIHPELIDLELGTRSINLSGFAHWLPTQYPQLIDVARMARPETTLVWSIGHQNFFPSTGIARKYPIDPVLALRFLAWGVPSQGLWDDVFYLTPGLQPLALRGDWRARFTRWLSSPLQFPRLPSFVRKSQARPADDAPVSPITPTDGADGSSMAEAARIQNDYGPQAAALVEHYGHDQNVNQVETMRDGTQPTSVALYMKGGGFYLIELDTEHFRSRQHAMPVTDEAAQATILPAPHPAYWRLFEESLAVLALSGVRVVVNEMEEAGYVYGHPIIREKWRQFMRERVQPIVEAHGFRYVRADFNRYLDADYFDYNHLNSRGIAKYTPELSALLRPHLSRSAH
jgi:hypothetical protein